MSKRRIIYFLTFQPYFPQDPSPSPPVPFKVFETMIVKRAGNIFPNYEPPPQNCEKLFDGSSSIIDNVSYYLGSRISPGRVVTSTSARVRFRLSAFNWPLAYGQATYEP